MQPVIPRRDPAPSRVAYRLNRLWLTPLFRALLRTGLPVFCVLFGAGWYLADQDRRDDLGLAVADLRRSIEERPEFMVKLMAIDGGSAEVAEDIREVLPMDFPISSFDLNLEEMRATVAELDAVASADLRIRPGGVLQIAIKERVPAIVWRGRDGLELLDALGHRVSPLGARAERADLPLIAGDGADRHVAQAMELLAAARPIEHRLRGLVRMGGRRWDVVLNRNQRILLPEQDPVRALLRVIALNQAEDMLDRDLIAIDMRNRDRPTIRMAPQAVQELRHIKTIEAGASNE